MGQEQYWIPGSHNGSAEVGYNAIGGGNAVMGFVHLVQCVESAALMFHRRVLSRSYRWNGRVSVNIRASL